MVGFPAQVAAAFVRVGTEFKNLRNSLSTVATSGSYNDLSDTPALTNTILNGNGAPAIDLGRDNDFYIDTQDFRFYGPKTGGFWGSGVPLGVAPVLSRPEAFTSEMWSLSNLGTGGALLVSISSLPSDGGSEITALQYQVGAGTWKPFVGTATGNYTISGLLDDASASIKIRAVNIINPASDSDTKTRIPTTATSLVVADQAIDFGDKTEASSGNYTLVVTGEAVVGASITSGDALDHWDIAANGDLTPSAVGAAANLNLGPYTLACSYNSGADTAVQTITIIPNTFSVATDAEVDLLFNSASGPHPVYGDTILMRAGIYNDTEVDQRIRRNGVVFIGDIAEKVTLKPDTGAEVFWRRLMIDNNTGGGGDGLLFENIIFEKKTNTGLIIAQQNGVNGLEFENCKFRVKDGTVGDDCTGVQLGHNGFAVTDVHFNNCLFSNLDNGLLAYGSGFQLTNTTMYDIYTDGYIHSADAVFTTPNDCKFRNLLIFDKKYGGTGSHGDFKQLNWAVAGIGPVTGLEVDNVKLFRGNGTSGFEDGQGFFCPGLFSGKIVGAKFINIAYFGTFGNGILVKDCQDSEFIGCSILFDMTSEAGTPSSADAILNTQRGLNNDVKDCIFNIWDDTDSTGTDADNNLVIASTTVAYSAMFKDPQYGAALTPANLYGSLESKVGSVADLAIPKVGAFAYSTLPGRGNNGVSAHPRLQDVLGLSFVDETGVAVSVLITTATTSITGVGVYGALVTVSAGEYRIRNAADDTTIQDWSSSNGIIQNGERLQLRGTSSGLGGTTTSVVVTVGTATNTWSITSAASAAVINLLGAGNEAMLSGDSWSTGGSPSVITNNYEAEPINGANTAVLLEDVNTGVVNRAKSVAMIANTDNYIASVTFKAGSSTRPALELEFNGGASQKYVGYFDTATGTFLSNDNSPGLNAEDLGDGWFRVAVSAANNGTNTSARIRIYPARISQYDGATFGTIVIGNPMIEKKAGSSPSVYAVGV